MLKKNRKVVDMLLLIWAASGIVYFIIHSDAPTRAIIWIAATSVPTILVIRMLIVIDKKERLENSKEFRIHNLIHAKIDGVVEIKRSPISNTYKAYTDTDLYMVEYGKTTSKVIHVGPYQRIDMEG